eukprot:CAMPEP_0116910164 /NCGR_PEP_ID=MMETSP0467-20121206/14711_1 /TAXON_ID=283647 /ORGANISM="Mesodinium pulex, Strain SPMC105" /LENGTH=95 /DNA_ID=CAMNT_0004585667 /DNA_START=641 /DNA_END=928 /DNA_ORIENTATION=+
MELAKRGAVHVHNNITELLKLANTVCSSTSGQQSQNSGKKEVNLFSGEKSSQCIIESSSERKTDSVKQMKQTLEELKECFINLNLEDNRCEDQHS